MKKLPALLAASVMAAGSLAAAVPAAIPHVSAASGVNNSVSDPDGDGIISINDAILIETYLSGISEPTNLSALDFDKNGIISKMDSTSVQLYLADIWLGD